MKYKMENPNKIANLVEGNFSQLTDLYLPRLLELQDEENSAVYVLDSLLGVFLTKVQRAQDEAEQLKRL